MKNSGTGSDAAAKPGRKIKYLFTAAASVLAVFYLLYHIFGGFWGGASLFNVTLTDADRVYDVRGTVFKSEKAIPASEAGVVDRLLEDGGKFSADSCVAEVYYSAEADAASEKLEKIDEKIEVYEKSSLKNQSYYSVSALDSEINAWYAAAASGGAGYTAENGTALMILLARRELIVAGRTEYDSELEQLYASRAKLISSLGTASEKIIPGESGWYYSSADGYESVFSADRVNTAGVYTISVADYRALRESSPVGYANCAGSYMTSATWYYVAEIPLTDASIFTENKSYDLTFEYAEKPIKCTLGKITADTAGGSALLIFRSDVLSGMSFVRDQSAAVAVSRVSGLRVPVSSLRVIDADGTASTGVFVLYKGCAYFKKVSVLFESEGYYICDAAVKSGFLALNDRIIIGEKDLFDGKVIE